MYRNKDIKLNKKIIKHINKHESSKDDTWNLYYKNSCLFDLWDYARSKHNSIIDIGYGNVLSDVFIILDSSSQVKRLKLLTYIINTCNEELSSFYVSFINKTKCKELNNILINKEYNLLKPKYVIIFNDSKHDLNFNDSQAIILNGLEADEIIRKSEHGNFNIEYSKSLTDFKCCIERND